MYDTERVTQTQKDPKKVEAGRKGAAARKRKQEAILEELRKAKEDLLTHPGEDVIIEQVPRNETATRTYESHSSSSWLIGLATVALIGGIVLVYKRPQKTQTTPLLNNDYDPFIMR